MLFQRLSLNCGDLWNNNEIQILPEFEDLSMFARSLDNG